MSNRHESVIASRRYYSEPEGSGLTFLVSFERPSQDEPGSFQCRYIFSGAEQLQRCAYGVDELHALIVAFAMAGSDLEAIAQDRYGGKLYWEAGPAMSSLPTLRDNWPFKQST
jgi:hypothetical protein